MGIAHVLKLTLNSSVVVGLLMDSMVGSGQLLVENALQIAKNYSQHSEQAVTHSRTRTSVVNLEI